LRSAYSHADLISVSILVPIAVGTLTSSLIFIALGLWAEKFFPNAFQIIQQLAGALLFTLAIMMLLKTINQLKLTEK